MLTPVSMTVEEMKEAARMGAFLEHNGVIGAGSSLSNNTLKRSAR
jgi:hypothetical protein